MVLYRLISWIALGVLLLRLGFRSLSGGGAPETLRERLAPPLRRDGSAPHLWIHGASNGELTAGRAVITSLLARNADLTLTITANSETGKAMVTGWNLPRTSVRLAPFDHALIMRRFLDALRPAALIILENELWPNRLTLCAQRGIAVFVIGARMSEKSARFWQRIPGLAARLLGTLRYLSAQDQGSESRFRALGLGADRIGPMVNLKSTVTATANLPVPLPFPRAQTLLAASTHAGEEELLLDAFVSARRHQPDLRLILAPRHPRRRDSIEAALAARGIAFATRSRGQTARADTQAYLADTMGEMPLWYAAAGLCLVGGSLENHGGHTPFEPAACGAAILHGPHVSNFAAAYAALDHAGGARQVDDAAQLASALVALSGDAAAQKALAERATQALAGFAGGDGLAAFYAALAATTGLKFTP